MLCIRENVQGSMQAAARVMNEEAKKILKG